MDWIEILRWITLSVQFIGLGVQIYFTRKSIKNYNESEKHNMESLNWLRKTRELYNYKVTEVESDGD